MHKSLLRIKPCQLVVFHGSKGQGRLFQLDHIADSSPDDIRIVRFSDKIRRPQIQAGQLCVRIVIGGDHNDRNRG